MKTDYKLTRSLIAAPLIDLIRWLCFVRSLTGFGQPAHIWKLLIATTVSPLAFPPLTTRGVSSYRRESRRSKHIKGPHGLLAMIPGPYYRLRYNI